MFNAVRGLLIFLSEVQAVHGFNRTDCTGSDDRVPETGPRHRPDPRFKPREFGEFIIDL